ncbi:uncharacterized protein LOC116613550 [Nematostella vectensis]|uniref:uncharacterized protein LOC116613550 n=1 Tax=Nematostella vectensis TaxID=45351 RepID=UPI0020770414|nr:uncharacterized protein LOC116613550 [Nematostella vectensis]
MIQLVAVCLVVNFACGSNDVGSKMAEDFADIETSGIDKEFGSAGEKEVSTESGEGSGNEVHQRSSSMTSMNPLIQDYRTPDPCVPNPCLNEGRCLKVPDGEYDIYRCECPKGYNGKICQDGLPPASNEKVTRQGVCEPNPCKNQGTCKETGDEEDPYECDCLPEWKGDNCEYYVDDPCFPNPCLNGGKCKHGTMNETFRCICPKGFEGLNCEKSMTNGNPWARTFPNAKIVKLAKKYRAKTHYYYKNGELAKRSTGCECHNGNCGCCLHIQFLNIDDDVCLNSTFDANRLKLSFRLTWKGQPIFSNSNSVHNPPPICFRHPLIPLLSVCIKFTDISYDKSNFGGCVSLVLKLTLAQKEFMLGCFYSAEGLKPVAGYDTAKEGRKKKRPGAHKGHNDHQKVSKKVSHDKKAKHNTTNKKSKAAAKKSVKHKG